MRNLINTLLKFFLIANSIIIIIAILAVSNYLGFNSKWLIPVALFLIIIMLLVNAYVYVILCTSLNLPYSFDKIKNKIASGAYQGIDAFQKDIADFLIANFNHPGADVIGGIFNLKGANILNINCENLELSENLLEVNKIQNYKENNFTFLYLPISFKQVNLGYISLKFSGCFLPYTKWQLSDFIENYLDDQLAILLRILSNK